MRKNYILDANILIHDPHSIFQFADNTVIIPIGVIGELDRFKKERTNRGYNARSVVRLLDSLRGEKGLSSGVKLENGGRLAVYCEADRALREHNGHADLEILRVAQAIQKSQRKSQPFRAIAKVGMSSASSPTSIWAEKQRVSAPA